MLKVSYRLGRDEGEAIWMFDALDTIKAGVDHTGGSFTLVEFQDFAGSAVPLHVNDRWDNGFYILEGDYAFVVGAEAWTVTAGAWLFVPQGTPHAWRCDSQSGRVLSLSVPGGFDAFYREVGQAVPDRTHLPARTQPDADLLAHTAARHGITITGGPPRE